MLNSLAILAFTFLHTYLTQNTAVTKYAKPLNTQNIIDRVFDIMFLGKLALIVVNIFLAAIKITVIYYQSLRRQNWSAND